MTRVRNLFDLKKRRIAFISENNKELAVNYELGTVFLDKSERTLLSSKRSLYSDVLCGDISIFCENSEMNLSIALEAPDKGKLYRVFAIIAYLCADSITLQFYDDSFPWPVPKGFCMGEYDFSFCNRKRLLLQTSEMIEAGLKLLEDSDRLFSKLLYPMLHINNLDLVDVRFFGEFSLLEYLSKGFSSSSKILEAQQDMDALNWLKNVSASVLNNLDQRDDLTSDQIVALKRKFDVSSLNCKNSTKDKIVHFIESMGPNFSEFKNYVKDWNTLRNKKGIAHASLLSSDTDLDAKDYFLMEKLHRFLCDLMYRDFLRNT